MGHTAQGHGGLPCGPMAGLPYPVEGPVAAISHAPAAPSSSAPMLIFNCNLLEFVQLKKFFGAILHRN